MSTKETFTPGPWRTILDAQGPCMVMHPTLEGVAICNFGDTFKPSHGYHGDKPEKKESKDPEAGVTYFAERNANVRLCAASPDLYAALKELREARCPWHAMEAPECSTCAREKAADKKAKAALLKAEKGGV